MYPMNRERLSLVSANQHRNCFLTALCLNCSCIKLLKTNQLANTCVQFSSRMYSVKVRATLYFSALHNQILTRYWVQGEQCTIFLCSVHTRQLISPQETVRNTLLFYLSPQFGVPSNFQENPYLFCAWSTIWNMTEHIEGILSTDSPMLCFSQLLHAFYVHM